MDNVITRNYPLRAHLSMLMAEVFWGIMSPIAKDAMQHGVSGIDMVSFRVLGGAVLFWIASLFVKREHVPVRHITSPVNASIVTTSMPIFAMVLSLLILKEPVTPKKLIGVMVGCCGAVILILSSATASSARVGNIRGDLMCLGAQFSFALYLALFSKLVRQYSVFTVNKWMFSWATLLIWPFSFGSVQSMPWSCISAATWTEVGYVVFFGTFVSYILTMIGQQTLRPTVVGIYNYVQPIVAVTLSVATGLCAFTPMQALAVVLVFSGVWMVIKSKSKRDMMRQNKQNTTNVVG